MGYADYQGYMTNNEISLNGRGDEKLSENKWSLQPLICGRCRNKWVGAWNEEYKYLYPSGIHVRCPKCGCRRGVNLFISNNDLKSE